MVDNYEMDTILDILRRSGSSLGGDPRPQLNQLLANIPTRHLSGFDPADRGLTAIEFKRYGFLGVFNEQGFNYFCEVGHSEANNNPNMNDPQQKTRVV